MQLQLSVLTKTGGRKVNEDAYGVWSNPTANSFFCVVSDGAGGHGGGDVASKLVVDTVLASFRAQPACSGEAIDTALHAANHAVVASQRENRRVSSMRATAVVLVIDAARGRAVWGHLGDSRLYLFRAGRVAVQTRDHSVLQSMIDGGVMPAGDLRENPQRSALLTAIGDPQGIAPEVVGAPEPLSRGDVFLLCTDGLWERVDEAEMERLLDLSDTTEEWLRRLDAAVIAHKVAGQDNYSAVAIACS